MRFAAALLIGLLLAAPSQADVVVLVHGYAADASSWYRSGVVAVLQQNRRQHIYTPTLAAAAPLTLQSRQLASFLAGVRLRHPTERLHLVGHSAGGVVARLAILDGNPAAVDTLVTIAAPHLGTPRAAQGLDIAHGKPFFCPGPGIGFLKSLFGGDRYHYLRGSTGTLIELLPQGGGGVLDRANRLPHPDIEYHSVVRFATDAWVPPRSQDMNQVPALRDRVTVWRSPLGHGLHPGDAQLLLRILAQ